MERPVSAVRLFTQKMIEYEKFKHFWRTFYNSPNRKRKPNDLCTYRKQSIPLRISCEIGWQKANYVRTNRGFILELMDKMKVSQKTFEGKSVTIILMLLNLVKASKEYQQRYLGLFENVDSSVYYIVSLLVFEWYYIYVG